MSTKVPPVELIRWNEHESSLLNTFESCLFSKKKNNHKKYVVQMDTSINNEKNCIKILPYPPFSFWYVSFAFNIPLQIGSHLAFEFWYYP